MALLVDTALDGLGLAYVFESMVRHHVAEKRLVRALDKYCPQIPGYFLYYPSRMNIASKLKALVDVIKRGKGGRGTAGGGGMPRSRPRPASRGLPTS